MPATVSIVIPVYRSEESLDALVTRILAVFETRDDRVEIVLVDDLSPDQAQQIVVGGDLHRPAGLAGADLDVQRARAFGVNAPELRHLPRLAPGHAVAASNLQDASPVGPRSVR